MHSTSLAIHCLLFSTFILLITAFVPLFTASSPLTTPLLTSYHLYSLYLGSQPPVHFLLSCSPVDIFTQSPLFRFFSSVVFTSAIVNVWCYVVIVIVSGWFYI
jgi:hypothetical protein